MDCFSFPLMHPRISILVSDLAAGGTHYQSIPAALALLFHRPTRSSRMVQLSQEQELWKQHCSLGLLLLTKISAGIYPDSFPGIWGNSLPATDLVFSSRPLPVHEN